MIIEIYNLRTGEKTNRYTGDCKVKIHEDGRTFRVTKTQATFPKNQVVATYTMNAFGFSEHRE